MADKGVEEFSGPILVGSKIIDYLSSGLYQSPASCLKELVNNSYDADATEVQVLVKPDADTIAIEDNGTGMSRTDFERHFSRISESHKRDGAEHTASGRPKVGKIGIGFIAANELCDEMEIYSTQVGSKELLHVTIDFGVMRAAGVDRRVDAGDEFKKGDYAGEVTHVAAHAEHFTKIYLNRVRGAARDALAGAEAPRPEMRAQSLYGLKEGSVRDRLASLKTWSELDAYSQTRLGVALNVPVRYAERWVPLELDSQVHRLADDVRNLKFNVVYDGTQLEKPVVLTESDTPGSLLTEIRMTGSHVSGHGYLFARHGLLRPTELNGIMIRIRNAAVGEYSRDFLGFPSSTGQLFQRWISGEFYADDALEEALNIDRRTLRETHPAYVELREWLHDQVSDFLSRTRSVLYTEASRSRARKRTAVATQAIQRVAEQAGDQISPAAGRAIVSTWATRESGTTSDLAKPLNRNYTVAEIYQIAIEISAEVLPPELAAKFLDELNRRLRD